LKPNPNWLHSEGKLPEQRSGGEALRWRSKLVSTSQFHYAGGFDIIY